MTRPRRWPDWHAPDTSDQPPDTDGRWTRLTHHDVVDVLDELRVPADAPPADAQRRLALAGYWATFGVIARAQTRRKRPDHEP